MAERSQRLSTCSVPPFSSMIISITTLKLVQNKRKQQKVKNEETVKEINY